MKNTACSTPLKLFCIIFNQVLDGRGELLHCIQLWATHSMLPPINTLRHLEGLVTQGCARHHAGLCDDWFQWMKGNVHNHRLLTWWWPTYSPFKRLLWGGKKNPHQSTCLGSFLRGRGISLALKEIFLNLSKVPTFFWIHYTFVVKLTRMAFRCLCSHSGTIVAILSWDAVKAWNSSFCGMEANVVLEWSGWTLKHLEQYNPGVTSVISNTANLSWIAEIGKAAQDKGTKEL